MQLTRRIHLDRDSLSWVFYLATFVLLIVAAVIGAAILRQDAEQEEDRETIDALAADLARTQDQVRGLGEQPVTPPPEQTVEQVERGERGPEGPPGPPPTDQQVREAVADYLRRNPPRRGRPPTDEEVEAAVAAFCAATRCIGPAGAPGAPGAPGQSVVGPRGPAGEDGETVVGPQGAPGEPGPPPSDQQVAEAVAQYCAAHGGCAGPAGPAGPPGADGAPGPVVACDELDPALGYQCRPTGPPPTVVPPIPTIP